MDYNQSYANTTGEALIGRTLHFCLYVDTAMRNGRPGFVDNNRVLTKVEDICSHVDFFRNYPVIFILLLGIPGNILSLLTIRTMALSTGTFYVALLSMADFITLSMHGIFHTLERLHVLTVAVCKLKYFLWSFTSLYAHWTLVLITFERFLGVRFPLQKSYYFTIKRARMSAFVIGVVMLGLSSTHLWSASFDNDLCSVDPAYTRLHKFGLYLEVLAYTILPFALIFLLVIAIAVELRKIQSNRKLFMGEARLAPAATSGGASCTQAERQSKIEHSITVMLFFSATVFLILTLPACIVVPRHYTIPSRNTIERAESLLAHAIVSSISLFLHACNVIIYFVSANRFRQQLMVLLHCRSCFEKPDVSSDTGKEAVQSIEDVPTINVSVE
ncbi:unnamed protein product [Lymnaea stagnalis]|uniref:G-protein coupled receptors family 1 profile domain-containing protein n=1 Tax=Lymnaea stagnalis TaxID=6523 RepID=A0AAV2HT54_LYMST